MSELPALNSIWVHETGVQYRVTNLRDDDGIALRNERTGTLIWTNPVGLAAQWRLAKIQPAIDLTPHDVLPASTDLTSQLDDFHQAAEAERVSFPWAGLADGPLRVLRAVAEDLVPHLRATVRDNDPSLDDRHFELGEVGKLTEEAGEAMKAYLRMIGISRSSGTERDYLRELADTVIGAFVCAHLREADLAAVIEQKLMEIYERGWTA